MSELIFKTINISALLSAEANLVRFQQQASSELEQMGVIQAFEYTYELCWKTMKKVLKSLGTLEAHSPKMVMRHAHQAGLIDDVELWLGFVDMRNQTVHVYHHEEFVKILDMIPSFIKATRALIEQLHDIDKQYAQQNT